MADVSLVALRDRREQAIQRLSDSFIADRLAMEEFEDRLAAPQSATNFREAVLATSAASRS